MTIDIVPISHYYPIDIRIPIKQIFWKMFNKVGEIVIIIEPNGDETCIYGKIHPIEF